MKLILYSIILKDIQTSNWILETPDDITLKRVCIIPSSVENYPRDDKSFYDFN